MALIKSCLAGGGASLADWLINKVFSAELTGSNTHVGAVATFFVPCSGVNSFTGTLAATIATNGSFGGTIEYYDSTDTIIGSSTILTEGANTLNVPSNAVYAKLTLSNNSHGTAGGGTTTFTFTAIS